MLKRISIWALVASSLACGSTAAAPGDSRPQPRQPQPQLQPQLQSPPISAAARQAKATPYARATTRTAWPANTVRRQLVISRGWTGDEGFAWLVADGTKFVAVYRTSTKEDLDDLVEKFVREMVFATVGAPTDKRTWGIAGVIQPPPPPPPEPGGFPGDYVDRVMAAAWRLDTQVLQPQAAIAGGAVSAPR